MLVGYGFAAFVLLGAVSYVKKSTDPLSGLGAYAILLIMCGGMVYFGYRQRQASAEFNALPESTGKNPPGCFPAGGGCLALAGLGVAGFFFALTMTGLASEEKDGGAYIFLLVLCIIMLLFGIVMMYLGFRQWQSVKLTRAVMDIIINQGHRSLSQIVALIPELSDTDKSIRVIQKTIKKGYLPGFRLDLQSQRIVARNEVPVPDAKARMVTFKCPSCGATALVPEDKPRICEYCGQLYTD